MPRKPVATPKPEKIIDARDAGLALKHWMKSHINPRTNQRWTLDELASITGISRTTLGHYLSGNRDLRKITQPIAQKLLPVLGMTDQEFWDYFEVPQKRWAEVRVFDQPVHRLETETLHIVVEDEIKGEWPIAVGIHLYVKPDDSTGFLLFKVGDELRTYRSDSAFIPAGAKSVGAILWADAEPLLRALRR